MSSIRRTSCRRTPLAAERRVGEIERERVDEADRIVETGDQRRGPLRVAGEPERRAGSEVRRLPARSSAFERVFADPRSGHPMGGVLVLFHIDARLGLSAERAWWIGAAKGRPDQRQAMDAVTDPTLRRSPSGRQYLCREHVRMLQVYLHVW